MAIALVYSALFSIIFTGEKNPKEKEANRNISEPGMAGELAPAANPDQLSLIPRTYKREGENQLLEVLL